MPSKNIFLLILSLLFALSCTVQKRKYQKGFYVSSFHSEKKTNKERETIKTQKRKDEKLVKEEAIVVTANDNDAYASSKKDPTPSVFNKKKHSFLSPPDTCDLLTFKDGHETRVKILEVAKDQIKYKRCDLPNGPLYVINKSELSVIYHSTGAKEIITQESYDSNPSGSYRDGSQPQKPRTVLANLALTFSLLGIYPFIVYGGVAGIVLATIQLNKIKANPQKYGGKGKAKAALIIGIITAVVWTFLLVLFFAYLFAI